MSNSRLDKLLEMLKLQPEDPFLIYATGLEYESAGDDRQADEYYIQILTQFPDYLPVYYQAGNMYARLGKADKAMSTLNKGIEIAKSQNDKKTLRELMQAIEDLEDE